VYGPPSLIARFMVLAAAISLAAVAAVGLVPLREQPSRQAADAL
jgi:hypothetical protein